MNYRLNTPAIVVLVLFLLLAVGLFGYTYMNSQKEELLVEEPDTTMEEEPADTARILTAKHDFSDGTHVVAGELDMPTPCERLTVEPFFVDGDTSNVELHFQTINESEEACAQVITPARFKVEFAAPESAAISATLNGESVVLNLVDIPEGEDLESFDEYIKG